MKKILRYRKNINKTSVSFIGLFVLGVIFSISSYLFISVQNGLSRTTGPIETEYLAQSPLGAKGGISLPASCESGVWNNNASTSYHLVAPYTDPGNCGTNTGTCGSANGVAISSAPTAGLCGVGTPSSVTGSGPFIWTCNGVGGGAPASCSAPIITSYNCEVGQLNPGLAIIANHTVVGVALNSAMRWYSNIWGGSGVGGCFYNTSGNNYFVPTATQAERNAFQNNTPAGVSKGGF
jgi:hypothetical protein